MADELIIPENVIKYVRGTAIPKPEDKQNTDAITPARYLIEITFKNMGEYVFFDERYRNKDPSQPNPEHPFNNPAYNGANILLAGANFGIGSSREHSPQAIKRFGIDGIIAVSFAEIFAKNCQNIGLVGVTISREELMAMVEAAMQDPSTAFEIDLEGKAVKYDSGSGERMAAFDMPEGRRNTFLTGTWDAITVLRHYEAGIAAAEKRIPYLHFK